MKKFMLLLFAAFTALGYAQSSEFFRPSRPSTLRLPAVPLITSDPYFSVWSAYDKLTDGGTTHWTGDDKPLEGLLRVDGVTYRWMGATERCLLEAIIPTGDDAPWEARYTREKPREGWEKPVFDDSAWSNGQGAFGTGYPSVHTEWNKEYDDIYIRRSFRLTREQIESDLYFLFSHDDACEIYFNGKPFFTSTNDYETGLRLHLTAEQRALLREGDNVIAFHCNNKAGGAIVDFGLYRNIAKRFDGVQTAEQKSVTVLACNTYYTFAAGPVELDVVFTAPHIIDDLDLLSSPTNYISYQVRSTDERKHDVQLLLAATPQMALNRPTQATVSTIVTDRGQEYAKTGTIEQPILAKTGDGICIDWGYFYLSSVGGKVAIGTDADVKDEFLHKGCVSTSGAEIVCRSAATMPTLAYVHDFGLTLQGAGFTMVGYDEVEDIEYFYKRYKGYWAHGGTVSIFDVFRRLERDYASIMKRCRQMDCTIYDDALAAAAVTSPSKGDQKAQEYAEILSASYRHVNAAHKLFVDDEGHLLFFSKENASNGCVNTVDLTYPEAPLYLCYNPALQKAMMTSILEYSRSGRWTKPFAAHDLGQYPKANGQVYGGDMPLEEAGNMLILAAQLTRIDSNASYVNPYWDILTQWADYLVENGLHPENQLCTDDFAGHWAGNCNLAIKAIMGIEGYAQMARIKGLDDVYKRYDAKAREMAEAWERETRCGDHYELAYGAGAKTWSQKYNMVWDKLWDTHVFPADAMKREVAYYLRHQNRYGLPLDCRKDYTKSDWIMWTAAMAERDKEFLQFVAPVYRYINETPTRVPISDWSDTKTGEMVGFKARSVIGGYWMRVLDKKLHE